MDNQLLPQAPSPGPDPGEAMAPFHEAHGMVKAQFEALGRRVETASKARSELDNLVKLGDLVTSDDVIKGAGGLVAAGMSAEGVASLLADMPTTGGGAMMQAWLQKQDQSLKQREAALDQQHGLLRHEMGVSAMRMIIGHSMLAQQAPGPGIGPAQSAPGPVSPADANELAPGPNQESSNAS